jgi:hypothetical protein
LPFTVFLANITSFSERAANGAKREKFGEKRLFRKFEKQRHLKPTFCNKNAMFGFKKKTFPVLIKTKTQKNLLKTTF